MRLPLVYIIVLNYCSFEDTRDCIGCIRKLDHPNTRTLVIDNDSPDSSGEKIRDLVVHEEFLQMPRNIGYAGGNNAGIRYALERTADYVFVINPDVRLKRNSVSSYTDYMERNEHVYALNPIQLSGDGKTIDHFFNREMFVKNGYAPPPVQSEIADNEHWEVKTLFGAALFMRVSALKKVGVFDPLYFAYWEEVDWSRRAKLHGGELHVISSSPVMHLRSYLSKPVDKTRRFLRLKGQYLYRCKDPDKNALESFCAVYKSLLHNLFKFKQHETPEWAMSDYFKVLVWIIAHTSSILKHRKMDLNGHAYI